MQDLAYRNNQRRDSQVLVLDNLPSITHKSAKYRVDKSFLNLITDSLSGWQTLRGIRKPEGALDLIRTTQIDEAGEKLAQVLGTLKMNSSNTFDEISKNYQSIMEGVTGIEAHLLEDGNVTTEVIEEGFSDAFTLDEISAGSQQILILLTAIILAKDSSDVILIEEPEQHLHPGAEQRVYDLLEEVSLNGTQVFVTTHSDTFVNESGTEDIISVYRNDENITELEIVEDPNIDSTLSMLGYEKSDVYYSNAVVFVEDQSDKVVFDQFANTLGYSLKERGIRFVRLKGDNLYADAEPMLKLIQQLRMPYMFILDSDDMIPKEKSKSVASKLAISPDNVYVLERPIIESYLIDYPDSIVRAFNIRDEEVVKEALERAGKRDHARILNRICKEEFEQSMSKKAINGLVARHMERDEIPREVDRLLKRIRDLTKNNA
ncbi:SMC domain protein [Haladaptatus paucihalophilus DX253]|nr:SMC domain protein [Haladaptatus paucihalophilus DX253]